MRFTMRIFSDGFSAWASPWPRLCCTARPACDGVRLRRFTLAIDSANAMRGRRLRSSGTSSLARQPRSGTRFERRPRVAFTDIQWLPSHDMSPGVDPAALEQRALATYSLSAVSGEREHRGLRIKQITIAVFTRARNTKCPQQHDVCG